MAQERLEGMNGMMLTLTLICALAAIISFENVGRVIVSPGVKSDDFRRLGSERLV
jgi:hypothetical protein